MSLIPLRVPVLIWLPDGPRGPVGSAVGLDTRPTQLFQNSWHNVANYISIISQIITKMRTKSWFYFIVISPEKKCTSSKLSEKKGSYVGLVVNSCTC